MTQKKFKNDSSSSEDLLAENSYQVLGQGRRKTVQTKYLNDTESAVTETIYDSRGNIEEIINPNDNTETTTYYKNGLIHTDTDCNGNTIYYSYDGLNRLAGIWLPMDNGMYSYKGLVYDKSGKTVEEKYSMDQVYLHAIPAEDRTSSKYMEYDENGNLSQTTTAEGTRTLYSYDRDGNLTEKATYQTEDDTLRTGYSYNPLGQVTEEIQYVNGSDLYGNAGYGTYEAALSTAYEYDLDGNILSVTRPDGHKVQYSYDGLGRETEAKELAIDENGDYIQKSTTKTYDLRNNVLTYTDGLNNTTTNEYDKRGNLTKTTRQVTIDGSLEDQVSIYAYDLAGRLISEVSPNDYQSGTAMDQLNRKEYVYDLEGRLTEVKSIYRELPTDSFTERTDKYYTYDPNGNLVYEQDSLGYQNG